MGRRKRSPGKPGKPGSAVSENGARTPESALSSDDDQSSEPTDGVDRQQPPSMTKRDVSVPTFAQIQSIGGQDVIPSASTGEGARSGAVLDEEFGEFQSHDVISNDNGTVSVDDLVEKLKKQVELKGGRKIDVLYVPRDPVTGRPASPDDAKTLISLLLPDLQKINPNFQGEFKENNCTECVLKVRDYLLYGKAEQAPKIETPRVNLGRIKNTDDVIYVKKQRKIVELMAGMGDGTVGIVGYWPRSSNGHVWNVWNRKGVIYFIDGQTNTLGMFPEVFPAVYQDDRGNAVDEKYKDAFVFDADAEDDLHADDDEIVVKKKGEAVKKEDRARNYTPLGLLLKPPVLEDAPLFS